MYCSYCKTTLLFTIKNLNQCMNCFRSRVKALQTVFNKTVSTTVHEEPINLKFSK